MMEASMATPLGIRIGCNSFLLALEFFRAATTFPYSVNIVCAIYTKSTVTKTL